MNLLKNQNKNLFVIERHFKKKKYPIKRIIFNQKSTNKMGSSMQYIAPDYFWNLEPVTIVLAGVGVGFTAINKQFIVIIYMLYLLSGVFNYLHLITGHKMNFWSTWETTDRIQANVTHLDSGYLSDEHTRFTADDMGGVRLMDFSFLVLAIAVYLCRKNFFHYVWFKKGVFSKKSDIYDETKILKFVSKVFSWRILVHYLIRVVQFWPCLLVFQFLSIKHISYGTLADDPFPWNALAGIGMYTFWFWGIGILWFWLWPNFLDPKLEFMLSKDFPGFKNLREDEMEEIEMKELKVEGTQTETSTNDEFKSGKRKKTTVWYFVYFGIIYVICVSFLIFQIIFMYANGGEILPAFGLTLLIVPMLLGLSWWGWYSTRRPSDPTGFYIKIDREGKEIELKAQPMES